MLYKVWLWFTSLTLFHTTYFLYHCILATVAFFLSLGVPSAESALILELCMASSS